MSFNKVVILIVSLAAFAHISYAKESRIIGGIPIVNNRQFSHHVNINTSNANQICGGTIIDSRWVLTLARCIGDDPSLITINFKLLQDANSINKQFSVSIRNAQIYKHPVGENSIGLIKLTVSLIFDNELSAISLSSIDANFGVPLVIPGYNTSLDINNFSYGMFKLLHKSYCLNYLGSEYDEYWQLCIISWDNFDNAAEKEDWGSGVIQNWQTGKQELVGVYGLSLSNSISAITNLAPYYSWIKSIITSEI